jgi:hypothetical protein
MKRAAIALALLVACAKERAPTSESASAAPSVPVQSASAPSASVPDSCGALGCELYGSAREAMAAVLADRPLVVAIGEAHAQKGSDGIDSSAKRFTAELLPLFKDRASDLVVELLLPPSKQCAAQTKEVKKRQEPVTQKQAAGDQNEYVAMANAARAIGIVPDLLRPTCEDMAKIAEAKPEDAVPRMLETIKRVTVTQVSALLARKDHDPAKLIIVYGGAFHGDPDPPPTRAAYSFASELAASVGGRYAAIGLFVPEFITDDDAWKQFPWYAHFDKHAHPEKVTMFRPRADASVIIFAATPR